MVDLSVDFAGITFRNPIWTASMTFGWSGEALRRAGLAGASGVVTKSIGSPKETFQHPRCGRMALYQYKGIPIGMQNNEIFSTIALQKWLDTELKVAADSGAKMVVSIVANEDPSDTAAIARKVAATRLVSVFELNVSCPMPAQSVGMNIGKNPRLVGEQIKAVKEACPDIPLMPKLTPNVSDIAEIATACEEAGADAVAATNSVQAFVGVNVQTGRPILPAFGGYTGPAVRPIMLRCVAQIAQAVDLPISGIGGISTWEHAVEMMMLGATTVQVGTAILWDGYAVITQITDGIESFMEQQGYWCPEDFIGIALEHLITTEEMAKRPPMVPVLDRAVCTGCGKCKIVCGYDAIRILEDKTVEILTENCDGCGLCVEMCPHSALRLVEKGKASDATRKGP